MFRLGIVTDQGSVVLIISADFSFENIWRINNNPDVSKWKRPDRNTRSSWRRKCGTQSCAVTRPTTPDNISLSSSTVTLRYINWLPDWRGSLLNNHVLKVCSKYFVSRPFITTWKVFKIICHYRNLSSSRSNFRWSYYGGKENSRDDPRPESRNEETRAEAKSPGGTSVKSTNSFLTYKQPYFGWRSQERLKLNSSYLSTPSQRLASSLLNSKLSRITE